eukprot:4419864-Amphidinium_carterae.1
MKFAPKATNIATDQTIYQKGDCSDGTLRSGGQTIANQRGGKFKRWCCRLPKEPKEPEVVCPVKQKSPITQDLRTPSDKLFTSFHSKSHYPHADSGKEASGLMCATLHGIVCLDDCRHCNDDRSAMGSVTTVQLSSCHRDGLQSLLDIPIYTCALTCQFPGLLLLAHLISEGVTTITHKSQNSSQGQTCAKQHMSNMHLL